MSLSPRSKRRILVLAGILAFYTVMCLLNIGVIVTSRLSEGEPIKLKYPVVDEVTGSLAAALLVPVTIWFAWNFPIGRRNWPARLPLHLFVSVCVGTTHTLLMWGSRTVLWRLFGWGTYDYGDLTYRFLMEYHKQILGYWVVYFVVSMVAYAKRNSEREVRAKELERQLAEARLSALKMQLNPHFLFNALNMISAFVHEDPKRADTMIAHLSDFLRLTLSHAEAQEVPLEKELDFLNAYLAIMEARFGERLVVAVEVGPGTLNALIPHLILQPLVENAVKHSTAVPSAAGRVHVEATRWDSRLSLVVHDNGPGLRVGAEEALEGGVGLSNTRERLATLYGEDQRLELSTGPLGGLRVEIRLPYREAGTK